MALAKQPVSLASSHMGNVQITFLLAADGVARAAMRSSALAANAISTLLGSPVIGHIEARLGARRTLAALTPAIREIDKARKGRSRPP